MRGFVSCFAPYASRFATLQVPHRRGLKWPWRKCATRLPFRARTARTPPALFVVREASLRETCIAPREAYLVKVSCEQRFTNHKRRHLGALHETQWRQARARCAQSWKTSCWPHVRSADAGERQGDRDHGRGDQRHRGAADHTLKMEKARGTRQWAIGQQHNFHHDSCLSHSL